MCMNIIYVFAYGSLGSIKYTPLYFHLIAENDLPFALFFSPGYLK